MVPHLNASGQSGLPCAVHASEVFGVAFGMLLDCASRDDPILEIPLWTGLVLQALVLLPGDESRPLRAGAREHNPALPLKDIETALIRKAVDQARGNVAQAALALGISRATVYRTLTLLVESGLLREIDLGRDQTYYDPNFLEKPQHNHLICTDCDKVVEFEDDNIAVLEDCITRRLGFKPSMKSIRIEASCEELARKGVCASRKCANQH